LAAKGADVFVIEIVELLGGVGFATQIGGVGSAELQAGGEFVVGIAGLEIGLKAQCSCHLGLFWAAAASFGHGSPIFTHCTSASICTAASCGFFTGIGSTSGTWRTDLIKELPSGSPAMTTLPASVPRNTASRESSLSPLLAFSAPWHA
jgi:hypothetical protein